MQSAIMEKSTDLDVKYQKLAAEYSKVRSQATVLKKAVLDEQAKNTELKDSIKKHEQKIRKYDQEMESLIFRNGQLTKRISVLQQELQNSTTSTKKNRATNSSNNKQNNIENLAQTDLSVLDEELQKKILENAQLVSSMDDKEFELNELKDRNLWLQKKVEQLEKQLRDNELKQIEEMNKLKREKTNEFQTVELLNNVVTTMDATTDDKKQQQQELNYLHDEIARWRTECELLRSKPDNNTKLIEYYEKQLNDLYEKQQLAKSETNTLFAENQALYKRLEQLIIDKKHLQNDLDKSNEELILTTNNYKTQLDAMTEHLAAQNDKITKQCDEIQVLKHKISMKK